jgi:hypothetical protein
MQPFQMCFTDGGKPIVFSTNKAGVQADFVLATLMPSNEPALNVNISQTGTQVINLSVAVLCLYLNMLPFSSVFTQY